MRLVSFFVSICSMMSMVSCATMEDENCPDEFRVFINAKNELQLEGQLISMEALGLAASELEDRCSKVEYHVSASSYSTTLFLVEVVTELKRLTGGKNISVSTEDR